MGLAWSVHDKAAFPCSEIRFRALKKRNLAAAIRLLGERIRYLAATAGSSSSTGTGGGGGSKKGFGSK